MVVVVVFEGGAIGAGAGQLVVVRAPASRLTSFALSDPLLPEAKSPRPRPLFFSGKEVNTTTPSKV